MDTCTTEEKCFIYALYHPNSKRVYVGKTSKGMKRPRAHSEPGHLRQYAHLPRAKWIQSLKKRGLEPKIAILEVCERIEDLDEAEKFYISCFRAIEVPFLNLTDGGDGINGYRHSDKARARMSAKHKALANTEEGRKKMFDISNGYWSTPEAREKKRQERLGYVQSEDVKSKISAAHKGKTKTAEERVNMSAAAKQRWANPEYRARQVKAQVEAKSTDKAREQAAEWAKRASHDTHKSPEYRARQSTEAKAACASEGVRARKSAAATLKAQDPEYIAKLSAARKLWWAERRKRDSE